MSNYKNVLIALGFQEKNDYFTIDGCNKIHSQIMKLIYDGKISDQILDKVYQNDDSSYIIRVKITDTNLSINFIYDSGNSEHVIGIDKFDRIFVKLLRDRRLDELF